MNKYELLEEVREMREGLEEESEVVDSEHKEGQIDALEWVEKLIGDNLKTFGGPMRDWPKLVLSRITEDDIEEIKERLLEDLEVVRKKKMNKYRCLNCNHTFTDDDVDAWKYQSNGTYEPFLCPNCEMNAEIIFLGKLDVEDNQ